MLCKIDRFVDLSEVRAHLGPYSSDVGRPSIDPELMIRMLIVGYRAFAIAKRSTMRKARIALARRLAIIMHAMLRDGTEFAPA